MYIYIYGRITLLYSRNYHNIVKQLYFNKINFKKHLPRFSNQAECGFLSQQLEGDWWARHSTTAKCVHFHSGSSSVTAQHERKNAAREHTSGKALKSGCAHLLLTSASKMASSEVPAFQSSHFDVLPSSSVVSTRLNNISHFLPCNKLHSITMEIGSRL